MVPKMHIYIYIYIYIFIFKSFLKIFFLVCPIWLPIFSFFFQLLIEPGLGAGIDPGMALTPFSSSIVLDKV
jgi:hypothetical protein